MLRVPFCEKKVMAAAFYLLFYFLMKNSADDAQIIWKLYADAK